MKFKVFGNNLLKHLDIAGDEAGRERDTRDYLLFACGVIAEAKAGH